jgi:hypothetical protein
LAASRIGGLGARRLAALEQLHLAAQAQVGVAAVADEGGLDAAAEVDGDLERELAAGRDLAHAQVLVAGVDLDLRVGEAELTGWRWPG